MLKSARELRFEASQYHDNNRSIPAQLFSDLCARGESPRALFQEMDEDAGKHVPLFPLGAVNG